MRIKWRITFVGMWGRGPIPAQLHAFSRLALEHVVLYWHKHFLGRHFEESARWRYHYANRSFAYNKRKQREKHHTRPLVWRGEADPLSLISTTARGMTVSGTHRLVRGAMMGPYYLNVAKRDSRGQRIDKADELVRTTHDEAAELADEYADEMSYLIGHDAMHEVVEP